MSKPPQLHSLMQGTDPSWDRFSYGRRVGSLADRSYSRRKSRRRSKSTRARKNIFFILYDTYARMQVLRCCVLHDISSRHYFAPLASRSFPPTGAGSGVDVQTQCRVERQGQTVQSKRTLFVCPSSTRPMSAGSEQRSTLWMKRRYHIMDLPSLSFVGLGNGGGGAWGVGGICCAVGRRI